MSGSMKSDDMSVERVQQLVERAERLRMQSAAIPLKDLKVLLQICEIANEQRNASSAAASEPPLDVFPSHL
jgi:hypothetical protein